MKIANRMEEIEPKELTKEVRECEYIRVFVSKMMSLSNRLNEIDDDDEFNDALDIKENYLPAIQEFIFSVEG